jgi:xylan 1,4-beta-xylosidase
MTEDIVIDLAASGTPCRAHWRDCIGAGRVGEALRADFQKHLQMVQRDMPFRYLRAHGIFHDDMMVYDERATVPVLNWQYVDLVYDHWLSIGLRPFVELGFMPYALASTDETVFWWKGNITPPRDWHRWELLVERFTGHVIERYGMEEVRRWYFEVWNEPNLAVFWKDADFTAYMELYERSARAIKAVDPGLRVGGPASSGSGATAGRPPWGREFLAACAERDLPLDFFSTHPYPTVHTVDLSGAAGMTWDGPGRLLTDLEGVEDLLGSTGYSGLERHLTEWSSSPSSRDCVHDTAFMAPFIVSNNWLARGLTNSLAFWAVSDIFEENRLGDTPFHGGFGLVTVQGLKKPAYHGYWFLSRLGPVELASGSTFAATRRADGSLAVLLWNYCHYRENAHSGAMANSGAPATNERPSGYELFAPGSPRHFRVTVSGLEGTARVESRRFDRNHGSVYDAWLAMGSPAHLRPADVAALADQMEPETRVARVPARQGRVECSFSVEPHGVTLVEISGERSAPSSPTPCTTGCQ